MSRSSAALRLSSAASSANHWFERRVAPAMRRFGEYTYVAAVREALPISFIALLAGLTVLFFFVPVPGPLYSGRTFGIRISAALLPSFGVMAPALLIALSAIYARKAHLNYIAVITACAACFVLALPPLSSDWIDYLKQLGTSGLFLALVVCGVVAACVESAKRLRIPAAQWAGALFAVMMFGAVALAHVSLLFGIRDVLMPLAHLGDTYAALVLIVAIEMVLWTAGIHGPATLAGIVTPIYLTLQAQNGEAYAHHAPLPHIVVVSLFLFVFPGGSGATLPLAVMLLFSRISRLRTVGRVSLLPGFFNINEPLMFGAPVVFNPYLAIPYVAVPLLLATTTYAAIASGLVARPAFYIPSTIPAIVATYLATLDPRAIALTLVNIAIAAAVYFPFLRAYERHLEAEA